MVDKVELARQAAIVGDEVTLGKLVFAEEGQCAREKMLRDVFEANQQTNKARELELLTTFSTTGERTTSLLFSFNHYVTMTPIVTVEDVPKNCQ